MQTIYYNGKIIPMTKEAESHEAIVTENGKIAAVGTLADLKAQYPHAEAFDLGGGVMLPAFYDAHSHFSGVAYAFLQVSLENCRNFDDIEKAVAEFIRKTAPKSGAWITARDFDMTTLSETELPTLAFLDKIAGGFPLVVCHKSGHTGFFNSDALKRLGVTENTPQIDGGTIVQKDGKLTGYMEENAFLYYLQKVPNPDMSALENAFQQAAALYASFGITTVQEGMMNESLVGLYKYLTEHDKLLLDTVGYAGKAEYDDAEKAFGRTYRNRFRLGGMKLFLDGSPQAKTALMRAPYENDTTSGIATMTEHALLSALDFAYERKLQVLTHCNGDKAADMLVDAMLALAKNGKSFEKLRPVMVHAQFLNKDRMKDMKACGILPSFFPSHIYHYGDVHVKNTGLSRASGISPAHSAKHAGLVFTFHRDSPVFDPCLLHAVDSAVNRKTSSGKTLGESEKISVYDALCGITKNAAYQGFEEREKGTIEVGKCADLVILDRDPLNEPTDKLDSICVKYTIKSGKRIFGA